VKPSKRGSDINIGEVINPIVTKLDKYRYNAMLPLLLGTPLIIGKEREKKQKSKTQLESPRLSNLSNLVARLPTIIPSRRHRRPFLQPRLINPIRHPARTPLPLPPPNPQPDGPDRPQHQIHQINPNGMLHPPEIVVDVIVYPAGFVDGDEDFGEDTELDEPEDPEEGVEDEGGEVEGSDEAWGPGEDEGEEEVG
jgi:hypothetical protein